MTARQKEKKRREKKKGEEKGVNGRKDHSIHVTQMMESE